MTPDDALRQASMTAREYAVNGMRAWEDLTGMDRISDPEAMATFVAGFMQAAATDFAAWATQHQIDRLGDTVYRVSDIWLDNK